MTHGSLFSGIGGFDLAAEWMGWDNVFHCEINEFGQKILNYYWPNAISYKDITKTDFTIHRGSIDVLSGGFPCQPYSVAGNMQGTEDARHLWPEMCRAVREIQPGYVVGENVRGLVSWNSGMVFEQVQTDLEDEGYEVLPFLLPACAVNAPHRRDRIWFVAHRKSEQSSCETISEISPSQEGEFGGMGSETIISDTIGIRQTGSGWTEKQLHSTEVGDWKKRRAFDDGRWESISPVCRGDYGLSRELSEKCLEGYGNAIVPQVVYQIFKVINKIQ